jgi:hypothetical protein
MTVVPLQNVDIKAKFGLERPVRNRALHSQCLSSPRNEVTDQIRLQKSLHRGEILSLALTKVSEGGKKPHQQA